MEPTEITLGDPVQMVGQTGFLKDAGGGRCSGCGRTASTLLAGGVCPRCVKPESGDGGRPVSQAKTGRRRSR